MNLEHLFLLLTYFNGIAQFESKTTLLSEKKYLTEDAKIIIKENAINVNAGNEQKRLESSTTTSAFANDIDLNSKTTVMTSPKGQSTVWPEDNYAFIKESSELNCISLNNASGLTQIQLIERLTAPCRYDRLERPMSFSRKDSITVYAGLHVNIITSPDSSSLFKLQGTLQLRYKDTRLAFGSYAPNRTNPIVGEKELRDLIWIPHIFIVNEEDSSILGTNEKDILTSISADGTVIIYTRIKATLFCRMRLEKFPFDEQQCTTILESWVYNASELILQWESKAPITFDPVMHLTGYSLTTYWNNETIVGSDLRYGSYAGNYSALSFTVHLTREAGYYIMDYFLPSILIVAISWVSFWLQADNTPARTVLGTSTLLSFITLASSQDKNLPKKNYVKISEVWFLGCTLFIFGSLVEFAFSNTIWRRKRNLELKKVNSKHILKSTITPTLSRQKMMNNNRANFFIYNVNDGNFQSPETPIDKEDNLANELEPNTKNKSWSTLTPQEASLLIDRKARFFFPLAFLIFNSIFWTVVYCM